jgi:hypothetical protein
MLKVTGKVMGPELFLMHNRVVKQTLQRWLLFTNGQFKNPIR